MILFVNIAHYIWLLAHTFLIMYNILPNMTNKLLNKVISLLELQPKIKPAICWNS